MTRIIITAQGFGFGPTSKAGAIAAYIKRFSKNAKIDFMGEGVALDLARGKKKFFNKVYAVKNDEEIALILKRGNYNCLISVMDPKSVVIAKSINLKVFLVDSLFWFWDWKSIIKKNSISKLRNEFSHINLSELSNRFRKMPPHETQLIGHLLSDKTFIQAYPKSYSRRDINFKEMNDVEVTGPIIDDYYLNKGIKQDRLMISFCGQKNPIVDKFNALEYCQFGLDLINGGLSSFSKNSKIKPVIVGHPEIMGLLKKKLKGTNLDKLKIGHLKHEEYYRMVNRSVAVIGPASITTFYDCHIYGKPYIFLPEQHDNHWPNYSRLTNTCSGANPKKKFQKIFPGVMLTPLFKGLSNLREENITGIYKIIKDFNSGKRNHLRSSMRNIYLQIIWRLIDKKYRRWLFNQQSESLDIFEKYPFNGARTIAKRIILES